MHCKTIVDCTISIVRVYGITQDPETKNYMMVLEYAENGSLRTYLDKNHYTWFTKLEHLRYIALGLESIHEKELIHRDLHIGNILSFSGYTSITDLGLCKPADYNASENTKNSIYGVLPYIAPEVLRGQNYTKAADIYSFGIIMYEIISGLPPYHDTSHDNSLAMKICQGLRPMFKIKVPKLVLYLIKRCLDANSLNRPTAIEIRNKLLKLKLQRLIKEEVNDNLPIGNISLASSFYETHSEAIYISRLLEFNNLPEPKNSDDYYEHDDNIISTKFSGIRLLL
jgi:serine/threonine protein kinase